MIRPIALVQVGFMVHKHRNPLHTAIASQSAQQWQKALTTTTADNLLSVCSDPSLWGNLPPFKSFLFARHIFSLSKLNPEFLDRFVHNVPQLGEYVSKLQKECVSARDLQEMIAYLVNSNKFSAVEILTRGATIDLKQWIAHKSVHVKSVEMLVEKDAVFFSLLKTHAPWIWEALVLKTHVILSGFVLLQKRPHILTGGEYAEENDLFLSHISWGNHKPYLKHSPVLFLSFLLGDNIHEDPQNFNQQLWRIKARFWVSVVARLYHLGVDRFEFLMDTLSQALVQLKMEDTPENRALDEHVQSFVLRQHLWDELGETYSGEALKKI